MAHPVIMPRQGQSVESCILTEWYKEPGDAVEEGDLLFAYETDKAAFEEESKETGILLARFFAAGDEVPVLSNVAVIGNEGEAIEPYRPGGAGSQEGSGPGEVEIPASGTVPAGDNAPAPPENPIEPGEAVPVVSPRARRLATQKRVELKGIRGSGPGGRVIERDVEEEIRRGKRLTPLARKQVEGGDKQIPERGKSPYGRIATGDLVSAGKAHSAGDSIPDPGEYTDEPLSQVRKLVAGAMMRSLQNSAQLTHHLGANATAMLDLRRKVKQRAADRFPNITLNDMVCYAVTRALMHHPAANAHLLGDTVRKFRNVHLGLAVDTERGLLVPVLRRAEMLSLRAFSGALAELAAASRSGSISPDLLDPEAASFTVSNLGNYGVEMFTPVINLPQVAILGVNTIVRRPVSLEDGNLAFQPFIGLSLTYDHRAIDGGPATLFLAEIKNQIESLNESLLDP